MKTAGGLPLITSYNELRTFLNIQVENKAIPPFRVYATVKSVDSITRELTNVGLFLGASQGMDIPVEGTTFRPSGYILEFESWNVYGTGYDEPFDPNEKIHDNWKHTTNGGCDHVHRFACPCTMRKIEARLKAQADAGEKK